MELTSQELRQLEIEGREEEIYLGTSAGRLEFFIAKQLMELREYICLGK